MGCLSRCGLLFAMCLVGLTAIQTHGKAIRSAPGTLNSASAKDLLDDHDRFLSFRDLDSHKRDLEAHKAKYSKVLQQLEEHPKFKEAKARNDRDAEERRKRMNRWMEQHPESMQRQKPSDPTKAKYEKVLEELKGSSKYRDARKRFGGDAEKSQTGAARAAKHTHSEADERLGESSGQEGSKRHSQGRDEDEPSSFEQEPQLHDFLE